jgi:hypothetical protein
MRFNHMELTVPRGTLDERAGRADISRFYGEVFGWGAIDVELFEQKNLLLHTDDEVSQFLLVSESDESMQSPGFDHLGVLVETRAEVDRLLGLCREYAERDDRVTIKNYDDLDQQVVVIHAFYVKYILPIYFDIQCMEWRADAVPRRCWTFG